MAVGDFLTLCGAVIVVFLGGRAVARQTWDAWLKPMVLRVFPPRPVEIMSNERLSAPSEPSVSKTDAQKEEAVPPPIVVVRSLSLDTCKLMRNYGLTRDQARAVARSMDYSLDNNVWAKAAPAPEEGDGLVVNPYSGRVTNKKFYPDQPDLEYRPLES